MFWINLPFGALAVTVVVIFLHLPHTGGKLLEKLKRIDFLGVILLVLAVICLVMAIQGGGSQFAWDSGASIGLFVGFAVLIVAFGLVETYLAAEPVRDVIKRDGWIASYNYFRKLDHSCRPL